MLSTAVEWVDVDDRQWARLWEHLYGARRRPHRLVVLLDGGRPLAILDTERGQVAVESWPAGAPASPATAARLRAQLGVDQVVLVESSTLVELWDRQQRLPERAGDYDDYVLAMRDTAWELLGERAVWDPPGVDAPGVPPIRYRDLRDLVAEACRGDCSFLFSVFEGDEPWWTLAGAVRAGEIVRLTSSQGLLPPGAALPEAGWETTQRELIEACAAQLGAVRLAVAVQRKALDRLLTSAEPRRTLEELAASRAALIL